jgi:hypothetical protein
MKAFRIPARPLQCEAIGNAWYTGDEIAAFSLISKAVK